jgi:hypothetical protein
MNIQELIKLHREGDVTFLEIGYPQHVCANDDDYIEYINYCWEYLGLINNKISQLCFFNLDGISKLESIHKEVNRAHSVIEKCHKFLQKDADYLTKWFPDIYTGKLSQGKR